MHNARSSLKAIHALPLRRRVRVLGLSADQERVIALSGLRELLPDRVELLAGPGSAGSLCPASDVYQAIRLCTEHDLSLMVEEDLLSLPGPNGARGPGSLAEARAAGADVRVVSAPVEAVLFAARHPERQAVLFAAGFETLLVPLAGMLLEGLPENLSLLLCGRRAQALLQHASKEQLAKYDALLLPGNRSSLLGLGAWEQVASEVNRPGVVAGYTAPALLQGLHTLLQAVVEQKPGISNCYQPMVRHDGNAVALERLQTVFRIDDGVWRGIGMVKDSAYRLRPAFAEFDADRRFPDVRGVVESMPDRAAGCGCADVVSGRRPPSACRDYNLRCAPSTPAGPCMAALDGTCRVHSLASADRDRSVVGQ